MQARLGQPGSSLSTNDRGMPGQDGAPGVPSPPVAPGTTGTEPSVPRGAGRRWLAVLAIAITAGGLVWRAREARNHAFPEGLIQVNGRIEGDRVTVASKYAGRMVRLLVREGDVVRAGQVVAQLDDAESRARLRQAEASLQALIAQDNGAGENVALTSETTSAQVEAAQAVLRQAESGVGSARAEAHRAAAVVEAARSAVRGSEAGTRAAEAARDAAEASRQGAREAVRVAEAAREAAAASRQQSREATGVAESQVEAAEAQVRAARASVDSALAQFERASRDSQRYEELFAQRAVSASTRDSYVAAEKTAMAQLDGARETMTAATKELQARQYGLKLARQQETEAEATWSLRIAEVDGRRRQVTGAEASLRQALAQVDAAEENTRGSAAQLKEAEARSVAAREAVREAQGKVQEAAGGLKQARTAPRKVAVSRTDRAEVQARIRQARATVDELRSIVDNLVIRAPSAGTVTVRMQDAGEVVAAGSPLLEIVDLDRLYLKVFVPENQIGRLRLGLPARVYTDAFPHQPFPAEVRYIASRAEFTPKEVQTRSERVKLVYAVKLYLTENPDHRLTPGIPSDAVIRWKEATPWSEPRW